MILFDGGLVCFFSVPFPSLFSIDVPFRILGHRLYIVVFFRLFYVNSITRNKDTPYIRSV